MAFGSVNLLQCSMVIDGCVWVVLVFFKYVLSKFVLLGSIFVDLFLERYMAGKVGYRRNVVVTFRFNVIRDWI